MMLGDQDDESHAVGMNDEGEVDEGSFLRLEGDEGVTPGVYFNEAEHHMQQQQPVRRMARVLRQPHKPSVDAFMNQQHPSTTNSQARGTQQPLFQHGRQAGLPPSHPLNPQLVQPSHHHYDYSQVQAGLHDQENLINHAVGEDGHNSYQHNMTHYKHQGTPCNRLWASSGQPTFTTYNNPQINTGASAVGSPAWVMAQQPLHQNITFSGQLSAQQLTLPDNPSVVEWTKLLTQNGLDIVALEQFVTVDNPCDEERQQTNNQEHPQNPAKLLQHHQQQQQQHPQTMTPYRASSFPSNLSIEQQQQSMSVPNANALGHRPKPTKTHASARASRVSHTPRTPRPGPVPRAKASSSHVAHQHKHADMDSVPSSVLSTPATASTSATSPPSASTTSSIPTISHVVNGMAAVRDLLEANKTRTAILLLSMLMDAVTTHCEAMGLSRDDLHDTSPQLLTKPGLLTLSEKRNFWRDLNTLWLLCVTGSRTLSAQEATWIAAVTAASTAAVAASGDPNMHAVAASNPIAAALAAGPTQAEVNTAAAAVASGFVEAEWKSLQESVVVWGDMLEFYGLVDYENGFWEADILEAITSVMAV